MALIKGFHEVEIQYDGDLPNKFPINRGVKYGCILPLALFGIYFSIASNKSMRNWKHMQVYM